MRSSLVKHLWLIQPGEPSEGVMPIDAAGGFTVHFSPAWDLLCLRAFVLDRTGHTCTYIDTRLHERLENAFEEAEDELPPQSSFMALIYTETHLLASVGEIIRYLKQHHPGMPVTLFGPHVSAFPDTIELMPGVDFALCGDPEVKLRHLLDSLDVTHRQKLIPGLIIPGVMKKPPQWAADLRAFSLPDWQSMEWSDYRHDPAVRGAHIEVRMSRGHPGTPADVAWPGADEPFRAWPMDRMAKALQRCPGNGINEVFFIDPPGFWTDERLTDWLNQLRYLRSTQEWSFQMIARDLPDAIITELGLHGCHRIEIIIPTTDPRRQAELGMDITTEKLLALVNRLRNVAVAPQFIFWVEGPWPVEKEAEKIIELLKELGRPSFAIYPFPFHHDAPLYRTIAEAGRHPPPLEDWLAAAQQPDAAAAAPVNLWGGTKGQARLEETMRLLHRRIAKDPMRALQRWLPVGDTSLRDFFEERALSFWHRMTDKSGEKK
jgi:hypothetical protein